MLPVSECQRQEDPVPEYTNRVPHLIGGNGLVCAEGDVRGIGDACAERQVYLWSDQETHMTLAASCAVFRWQKTSKWIRRWQASCGIDRPQAPLDATGRRIDRCR